MTRRDFVKSSFGLSGFLAAGLLPSTAFEGNPMRPWARNPFLKGGKPVLVAVEGDSLDRMLRKGIEALGGWDLLLRVADQAVLKPNFVTEDRYPVTTSKDTVFTVWEQMRQGGMKRVSIFEAQGSRLAKVQSPERNMKALGILTEARTRRCETIAGDLFASREYVPVRNPQWVTPEPVLVHERLRHAGVVVNLPTLKRHALAGMSCALKNQFGSVMMAERAKAHRFHSEGDRASFERRLVEFADAVRPELTIVDARSLLTRTGPVRGEVVQSVNRLIVCGDIVAADAYCAQLLADHDSTFLPERMEDQLRYAASLGLGTRDLGAVEILEV